MNGISEEQVKECPHYEHEKEFDEHICHADETEECPEGFRETCKYEPELMQEDMYPGEFGLY